MLGGGADRGDNLGLVDGDEAVFEPFGEGRRDGRFAQAQLFQPEPEELDRIDGENVRQGRQMGERTCSVSDVASLPAPASVETPIFTNDAT